MGVAAVARGGVLVTSHEAKRIVIDHYESAGFVVYEQRVRHGLPALGQIVVVDPADGRTTLVRVMVGKRPPRCRRLLHDKKREGISDTIAIVDPDGNRVVVKSNPCSGRIQSESWPRDGETSGAVVRSNEEIEHGSPYPVPAGAR